MDGMLSHLEELLKDKNMLCKICGSEETDNPDGICDDCKFCVIDD